MTTTSAQLQGQVPQYYTYPQAQATVVYQQPQAQPGQQRAVPTPQEYQPAEYQPQTAANNMQQYQIMPTMVAQPTASNQMAPTHVPSTQEQAPMPVQQMAQQPNTPVSNIPSLPVMVTQQMVRPMMTMPTVPAMIPMTQYPVNSNIAITPACEMTVEQAANWIRTLGFHNQWQEKSESYAQAAFQHGLTGFHLHQLTTDDMEKDLGMEKLGHRITLFNAIRGIFPNAPSMRQATPPGIVQAMAQAQQAPVTVESRVPTPGSNATDTSSHYGENLADFGELAMPGMQKSRGSVVDRPAQLQHLHIQTSTPSWIISNSRCSTPGISDRMSETSNCTASSASSSLMMHPQKSSFTLLVTLDQTNEESWSMMGNLKSKFQHYGFNVEITPKDSNENTCQFVIVFTDGQSMNRALSMKSELDFNDLVVYNEPTAKKKGPRPTPAKPLLYKVLNRAKMREGKSMKSTVLGHVNKGDLYWVNQIKGKRARIVKREFVNGRVDPTKDKNLGWVSLRNNSGYMLMSQVLPAVGTPEFEQTSTSKNQFKFEVSTPHYFNAAVQAH